jgi:hypothetical protein
MAKKLPTDETEVLKLAQDLGVSTHGTLKTESGWSNIPELQSRIINAQRAIREGRLWWVALISAIASMFSALAAWVAVMK